MQRLSSTLPPHFQLYCARSEWYVRMHERGDSILGDVFCPTHSACIRSQRCPRLPLRDRPLWCSVVTTLWSLLLVHGSVCLCVCVSLAVRSFLVHCLNLDSLRLGNVRPPTSQLAKSLFTDPWLKKSEIGACEPIITFQKKKKEEEEGGGGVCASGGMSR